jgi:hypothetical protein
VITALASDEPSALCTTAVPTVRDPVVDDDLQLALWVCYELHYQGFDGVTDDYEWHPDVLAFRSRLEAQVLAQLRRGATTPGAIDTEPRARDAALPMADQLRRLVDSDDGPSLSRFIQTEANRAQFCEFVIHRSLYQLKEADPHTWAVPRFSGRVKAALVEIQIEEYGAGRPEHMHSELYRGVLRGLGLDDGYGGYVDAVPGVSLAISNIMTLFGLHRSLRGALVGHLAAYEMTSSAPCRRYAKGLRRLGGDDEACRFYDAHVTADALHEQIAAHDLCGALAAEHPELADDILLGAASSLYLDRRFAEHLLGHWAAGRTSLRTEDRSLRWLPSHSGLTADRPHRQRATVRPVSTGVPSAHRTSKSPRTMSGPSGYAVTLDAGRRD